jgi:hypothetical protein
VEKSGALGQFDSMDVKGCGAVSHKVHVHTANLSVGYNIFFFILYFNRNELLLQRKAQVFSYKISQYLNNLKHLL